MNMKKKVLITIGAYFPGYKIGGPAITIRNLISNYKEKDNLEFYVYCPNHDWMEKNTYNSIDFDTWVEKEGYKIFYASKSCFNVRFFKRMIEDFDIIYCTGAFTLFALAAGKYSRRVKAKRVIIAPMGSFFTNAIQKSLKKRLFFKLTKFFKVFDSCYWSVTSELEKQSVINLYGKKANIVIAEDPIVFNDAKFVQRKNKNKFLKATFVSRIHPSKGLLESINILAKCNCNIVFDVYGTIEDEAYFDKCVKESKKLPLNISFSYKGPFLPDDVTSLFSSYDVFILPTHSENFGHVIYESLKSSCIPLISNTTPWSIINEKGCGYVFPLNELSKFAACLDSIYQMKIEELNSIKSRCYYFAKEKYEESIASSGYETFFK